jgi:hypothetical protein
MLPEYRWIQTNVAPDAAFVASDDAVLYLYTGHAGMALILPSRLYYHADLHGIAEEYRGIDSFARRNHLRYLLRTPGDFAGDFAPAVGRGILDGLLTDPQHFRLLHRSQSTAVYEVVGEGAGQRGKVP